jgi:aspartate aminotransferase
MTPDVTRLNARLAAAQPSATYRMIDRVAERKAAGVPVLSLSASEPDIDTPQHVQDSAIAAIRAGHKRYTQAAGLRALREAVIASPHPSKLSR